MAMKKAFCELGYDFKDKIVIARRLFFLGSHKESNLKILAMARKHNLRSKDEQWKRFRKFQVF